MSVTDITFSVSDFVFSVNHFTFWVIDKVKSVADFIFSVTKSPFPSLTLYSRSTKSPKERRTLSFQSLISPGFGQTTGKNWTRRPD